MPNSSSTSDPTSSPQAGLNAGPSTPPRAPAYALTSTLLTERGFVHGFSTRAVDLHPGSADYLRDIARFAEATQLTTTRLHQAKQVHGVVVGRADRREEAERWAPGALDGEADAWVAAAGRGDVVGIRTADCVPILVGGTKSETGPRVVAAIHAGWQGFARGVVQAALRELEAMAPGAARVAAIGPCIGPCCFEVDIDVADALCAAAKSDDIVARRVGIKRFVDLRLGVRLALREMGLRDADIEDVPGCTRCEPSRFFSYRRDGISSGRLLAAIAADAPPFPLRPIAPAPIP